MKQTTVLCIFLLIGCTTAMGPDFDFVEAPFNKVPRDRARICLLRDAQMTPFELRQAPITIDGKPVGDVQRGSFRWVDVATGRHEIATRLPDTPGAFVIQAHFDAGRHYFVEILPRSTRFPWSDAADAAGWTSAALLEASGMFRLNPLPDGTARIKLRSLKLAR